MSGKMFDSEIKVMEMIWANEPVSAKELSHDDLNWLCHQ